MKNLFTILVSAFIITNILLPQQAIAQSPEKMKYQAVIRNSNGQVITDQSVGMQISILQGGPTGTVVYVETQTPTSNANGLIATEIGTGTVISGDFTTIDWANGPYFMKIETDPTGGTNYTITGTNQLLSVPYALHSKTADSLNTNVHSLSDADGDTKIQVEENPNEDVIRFDVGGTEQWVMIDQRLENRNSDGSIFIGENAGLEDDATNNRNIAIGMAALKSNTDRYGLVAIGDSALYNNGIGAYLYYYHATANTAVGTKSLYMNTTGYYNTANGFQALFSNTIGYDNTAIGFQALFNNGPTETSEGSFNTATGSQALYSNTTGSTNTAYGDKALFSNTTASANIAIGRMALFSNTTGNANTAVGHRALQDNITGGENTATGYHALINNTASNNTAYGASALKTNTTGYSNTAIGKSTLFVNTTGSLNTAIGSQALFFNVTGFQNTAVGSEVLHSNTEGHNNTAIGREALHSNITGDDNTAIGHVSLYDNSSGYENTAIGKQSLYNTTTAGRNVGVGYQAGFNNSTGFYNTAVGWKCGPATSNIKNSTAIGRGASTTATNQIRIGNNIVTSIGGYVSWSNISDKQFKKAIKNDIIGLDFIMALQPVSYQLDMDKLEQYTGNYMHSSDSSNKETEEEKEFNLQSKIEKGSIRQSGFIAQDVELAAESVGYDFSGVDKPKNQDDYYGLRYAEFVVPLVKALQEQQEIIEQQNKNYENLLKRVEQLEKLNIEQGKIIR
ncbi:MAG: hypothetical protein GXO89_13820 [Chlorobi bacterium]|nr:hypothetical protein [Chlorobiota bacterium]